ncbi:MAG: transglutaminase domain-containing protein [bacterium]|nr:transglutaminase domain-containing protein [bacterium]
MQQVIIDHYKCFSLYTNPGLYEKYLREELPNDIKEIGLLVRKQIIHRTTLKAGNTGTNSDLKYGDMNRVPWYRQPEDDVFPTVSAMMAELFRRDARGLTLDRNPEDKLVVTCRHDSLLVAAILKSKGIPTRVRSGFAPYFMVEGLPVGKSDDHWIDQYWDEGQSRWVTIDVDGSLHNYTKLNFYDLPQGTFDFSAAAWLQVRAGKIDEKHFYNAGGFEGLMAIAWELFYDFHCLMNNEIIYLHVPEIVSYSNFTNLKEKVLQEIDQLATLMLEPDKNFKALTSIWDSKREYRIMTGGLL